jgi:hypothetical protein
MTMTNSNNKRDNGGNTKAPNMPTNKTAVATSKSQPQKERPKTVEQKEARRV